MVRARLHLICGNCGCNDDWSWEHREEIEDENPETVWLWCGSCSTLHDVNDNADVRSEK